MRVPVSWLRDYVELPADVTPRDISRALIAAGLEVETIDALGADLTGPLVIGRVLAVEELTEFKKPIRYCQVDIGKAEPQNIICGAPNFAEGDLVVVILPGGVLPGGFEISARKTYGKVSEGMICSERELGMGEGHDGIIVLPESSGAVPGQDAVELLQLRDDVLDISITPDRGYTASIRGVARETATAFGVPFHDPAATLPPTQAEDSYPATVADPSACSRYVLREVRGLDPAAPSPIWLMRRLQKCGVRSISLAVDITNYLMLDLGQPLHAWDRGKLAGPIVVRRASAGERMETLDHVVRDLDPGDILITDESGPVNIAGVMGGLTTEIDEKSTDIVIEAAHFSPEAIARTARRHRLHSDSSYRFERGVDTELQRQAAEAAVRMLAELGGARVVPGETDLRSPVTPVTITMRADHPDRVAGMTYGRDTVAARLRDVGCEVTGDGELTVTPPSWRPDLLYPNDLAEEVIRLEGYENIPSRTPRSVAGRGLTPAQRMRRRVGRALAAGGYVEVFTPPFASENDWTALQLPADDARRRALRLVNPLTDDEPLLRTTLLPGLLRTLARNVGRGFADTALFEMGRVYRPNPDAPKPARPPIDRGPTADELAAIEAALPAQPLRVAAVLAGDREPAGWWGAGRPATWADAIEAARVIAGEAGVDLEIKADQHAPWHPGRCAALLVDGELVGHAGELHPRVIKAYDLPPRACAMELDLTVLEERDVLVPGPSITTYPVATQDVALIVAEDVPAATVEAALRAGIDRHGAGELLESIRLFDLYTGEQAGEGHKSLAYTLRFRAADRTLTAEETTAARDAAVTETTERVGAVLRGT